MSKLNELDRVLGELEEMMMDKNVVTSSIKSVSPADYDVIASLEERFTRMKERFNTSSICDSRDVLMKCRKALLQTAVNPKKYPKTSQDSLADILNGANINSPVAINRNVIYDRYGYVESVDIVRAKIALFQAYYDMLKGLPVWKHQMSSVVREHERYHSTVHEIEHSETFPSFKDYVENQLDYRYMRVLCNYWGSEIPAPKNSSYAEDAMSVGRYLMSVIGEFERGLNRYHRGISVMDYILPSPESSLSKRLEGVSTFSFVVRSATSNLYKEVNPDAVRVFSDESVPSKMFIRKEQKLPCVGQSKIKLL